MDLDQFKNWAVNEGSVAKTDGGYLGECVSLINQYLSKVYGIQAGAWGNAYAWANDNNPVRAYFDKVGSPQVGDIGVMGTNYGGGFGHIFVYLSPTTILEQNGRVARKVSTGSAYANPIAILRRKGAPAPKGEDMSTVDLARARIFAFFIGGRNGQNGKQNALDGATDGDLNANHVGRETNTDAWDWFQSDESHRFMNEQVELYKKSGGESGISKTDVARIRDELSNLIK